MPRPARPWPTRPTARASTSPDCRDGACGTCKCLAEAGRYALGQDYIDDALSAEEAARGYVLTCQMRAESDCVLRVPASSTLCRTGQARYEARISEVRQLSPSTIGLSLRGEALASLAFLPGQYVNLQVPGSEQRRAYSFSSLAKDGEVSFLIRNVPGGLMSGFLSGTARAGDSLAMDGPLGSFYLREIHRPLLMLAGGTGLAPFTAMLERIAEQGSAHPLHLVYGVTHDVDLVGLERLEAFAERIPRLHLERLRGQRRQRLSAQGLRDRAHRRAAPARGRRRHLPVRAAADGRGGRALPARAGRAPGEFLLRKFAASAA